MKTCYIIGAGEEFQPFSPRTDDLVIAADGGYRYLKKNDIRPALIVGDFDSIDKTILEYYQKNPRIIQHK